MVLVRKSIDDTLQALIQNVIIVDKEHIVIVLSDSDIHTNKEVSSKSELARFPYAYFLKKL